MKGRNFLRGLTLTSLALSALVVVTALVPAAHVRLPVRQRTTWDSVYTDEQATRGQAAYNRSCARCHLESLGGADESPALTGTAFLSNWNGLTLGELHARVRRSMPSDDPGTFGPQLITDVMAYMLRVNGFPAGKTDLTHEGDALNGVQFSAARP